MALDKTKFRSKVFAKRSYVLLVRSLLRAAAGIRELKARFIRRAVKSGLNPHEFDGSTPASDAAVIPPFGLNDFLLVMDRVRGTPVSVLAESPVCSIVLLVY